ncbi:hypothetical protein KY284_023706 [Solanum tuberosum]|nr:hypothetical protein KY284_023706 [Solanum tuberosum]
MMHFRDRDSPHPLLEIVGDDQQNPNAKVLLLEVQPPSIGIFSLDTSLKVPLLKSVIHHDTSSKSSHSDGSFNNWRVPSSNFGNVCYTPGYWEWVEDMLPLHKEILELIKVYDVVYTSLFTYDYDDNVLHAFCELWRPSTNTLSTFIGEMSISLWDLQAIGAKDDLQEVSVHDWVKFWFRGPNKYAKPPQKVSKEKAPFVELDVEESLRDETNLAAFFACWLCKFVLPNKKVNHVRASVFKVASLMPHGKKFSLAVPVLASIYRGLKEISTSSNLSDDARRLHHLAMLQGRDLHLTDNGKLSNSWNEYIISLRSSYEKSHPSSKSQVKSNDTLQVAKTSSKSKTSKDRDVLAKSKLRRLTLASKATSPAPKVGHGSSGTNELHVSSDNGNDQTSNLEMPCDEISHLYALPDGVGRPNASPSPTDHHWNHTIVIDDNDFVDEDSNSASLFELAKQLDLQELYGGDLNNGAVADFTVDLNNLDVAAKDFHSSINDDQPSLEVVPPRKSPSIDVMPSLEVVLPRESSSRPLRPGAPTLEPQETIYRAKSTFVSEMWGALCGWITQFSLGSSDGFTELESSIASTLEEIRKVNIIDVSSLEDHVENFFKSYAEYDTLRSSKMTKESHEKALFDAQRRLDGAKLAHEK